ncbi:MAG: DUF4366 domain-containing protein [Clostridia bacterium]|nr:DUF4366 domain-containing protein [Clostridia bacterium]
MKKKIILSVVYILIIAIVSCVFSDNLTAEAAVLKVGDKLTIGTYEQDNNSDNGKEAVSWIVLDAREGKALVISEKILDCRVFHKSSVAAWSSSDVRAWLNGTFYSEVFSDSEKSYVQLRKISNVSTVTVGDRFTEDRLFLLSVTEANAYNDILDKAGNISTAYAVSKGLFTEEGNGYWWLRTAGADDKHTAMVNPDGSVYKSGCIASYLNMGGIRPAMWIDLKTASLGGNTLTVNYIYSNGKTAFESYFAAISPGEAYSITSPAANGYKADKETVSGTMGDEDTVITVTYKSTAKTDRSISTPTKQSADSKGVTLNAVKFDGDGTVYYGYSLSDDISSVSNWQESTSFTGMIGGKTYYFFAKVTGSAVYNDAYSSSLKIDTEKAEREIDAPKIASYNHNSVSAYEISAYGGGSVSYGISTVNNPSRVTEWKNYPVFRSLSPGVKYYVFAKAAETENFAEAYSYSEVTTSSAKTGTAIPEIAEVTASSITVNPLNIVVGKALYGITDQEDFKTVSEWTSDPVFENLEPGKRYYIFTKIEGAEITESSACNFVSVVTKSGTRSISAPVVVSAEGTTVTLEKKDVVGDDFICFGISTQNNADTVSVWQISNVFSNLNENTEYFIFAKLSNGTAEEDIISESVSVKTTVAVPDVGNSSSPGSESDSNSTSDTESTAAPGSESGSDSSENETAASGEDQPSDNQEQKEPSAAQGQSTSSAEQADKTGSADGKDDNKNEDDKESKNGKNSNTVLIVVICVIIVLLAGGGAAAYYFLVYKKKKEKNQGDSE